MPDQGEQKLQVTVSADEAEAIKSAASQQGVSVSQYLHARVFEEHSPILSTPGDGTEFMTKFEALLRHLIYIANRIHCAAYMIAETAGTLTEEQLQQIYDEATEEGVRYINELPEHIDKLQAQLATQPEKAAA